MFFFQNIKKKLNYHFLVFDVHFFEEEEHTDQ